MHEVLLIGAGGFLGQHLLKALTSLPGVRVTAMESREKPVARLRELFPDVLTIHHDAAEPFATPRVYTHVVFAAGIASPEIYKRYPVETMRIVTHGLYNALETARVHKAQLLFFSSSEVYGTPDEIPTPEACVGRVATMADRSCYDISKLLGETYCYTYNTEFKVHTNIVRPFNVYGPGMDFNDFRAVPNFVKQALRGEAIKVYGNGKQTRTFTYVADATEMFVKVLFGGVNGQVYNIGSPGPEVSLYELALIVSEICHSTKSPLLVPYPSYYPSAEPLRRCPDMSKMARSFGGVFNIPLRDGLTHFVEWAREAWKELL